MKCPACSVENKVTAKFCKSCGTTLLQSDTQIWPSSACKLPMDCGFSNKPGAKFCPKCGELNPNLEKNQQEVGILAQASAQSIESIAEPTRETSYMAASEDSHHADMNGDKSIAPLPIGENPTKVKSTSNRLFIGIVTTLSVAALAGGVYYYKLSDAISHTDARNSVNPDAPVITLSGGSAPQPTATQPVISPQPSAVQPTTPVFSPQTELNETPPKPASPDQQVPPVKNETDADRAVLNKINNAIDNLGK